MEKITVKELVEFRRRSDKARINFAQRLKNRELKEIEAELEPEGGGDYWIISNSCIYNVIKQDKAELFDDKIDEVKEKLAKTTDRRTQAMYQRNIDILANFSEFEWFELKPKTKVDYLKVPKPSKIILISGLPIYINPQLIFSFELEGKKHVGAIWLVPQLYGFSLDELSIFSAALYLFLKKNFSAEHQISPQHSIAVDTYNVQASDYMSVVEKKMHNLLTSTVEEIVSL